MHSCTKPALMPSDKKACKSCASTMSI
jgi:hypothetical protein